MPLGIYAKGLKGKSNVARTGSAAKKTNVDPLAKVRAGAPLKTARKRNPGASSLGMR